VPAALHGSLRRLLPRLLCWLTAWLLLPLLQLLLQQGLLTPRSLLCLWFLLLQPCCLRQLLQQLLRHYYGRCCQDLTCEQRRWERCMHQLVQLLLRLGWPLPVLVDLLLLVLLVMLQVQLLLCQHPLRLLHVLLWDLQGLMRQLQSCLSLQLYCCCWTVPPEAAGC
jgi:hypothetical protein